MDLKFGDFAFGSGIVANSEVSVCGGKGGRNVGIPACVNCLVNSSD